MVKFEFNDKTGVWNIQIKGVWYRLCCCKNCNEVHGFIEPKKPFVSGLMMVDEKIKCCSRPDNWCSHEYGEFSVEGLIKDFVNTYK